MPIASVRGRLGANPATRRTRIQIPRARQLISQALRLEFRRHADETVIPSFTISSPSYASFAACDVIAPPVGRVRALSRSEQRSHECMNDD